MWIMLSNILISFCLWAFGNVTVLVECTQICPLCGSPYDLPQRWNYPVDKSAIPFKTCQDVFFDMGAMDVFDPLCSEMQDSYKDVCCNIRLPPGWESVQTPSPQAADKGTEPTCLICGDSEYPGIPGKFISARYVGSYSCGDFFHRGKNGLIPGFMCGPLQDYAYDKCGCGPFNPNKNTFVPELTSAPVSSFSTSVTTAPEATVAPQSTYLFDPPSVAPVATPTFVASFSVDAPVVSLATPTLPTSGRKIPEESMGKDDFKIVDFTTNEQGVRRGLRRTMSHEKLPSDS